MKKLSCLVLILLLCQCSASKLSTKDSTDTPMQYKLYVDQLAQLYTVAPNNTIVKHDESGKVLFEYSDNTLGDISVFDVSNPLQLLVYHKDFQVLKIFDRTLTLSSSIDMNKLDLIEIRTVASANDNRIWIFDELNQELLKVDNSGRVQGRNNDLRLRLNIAATPTRIIEFKNKVYLFDPIHGILIFNAFGEYLSKRKFPYQGAFTYFQGKLFYPAYTDLVIYDLVEGTQKSILMPDELFNKPQIYKVGKRVIYLSDDQIKFTTLK